MTITGKTIAEILADVPDLDFECSKNYFTNRNSNQSNRTLTDSLRKPS